ncbi:MAG: hypothetical protein KJN76_10795 [Eudoraea sp.]|nr:hypothetical protein [Eudoraea sp.]
MEKGKNIITVHATRGGKIKSTVIQQQGKIKAYLVAQPELVTSDLLEHSFHGDFDPEEFSKLKDNFELDLKLGDSTLKKSSKGE